jgi:dGTPase
VRTRQELEKTEDGLLAAWAQRSSQSRGRLFPAAEHAYRTAFQRDRDRVIHSTAFRRLQYKTQVFVYHEGDHFRNRLTHTLEVAQIARTIARALGCNEDLTEAIVLAHDLGHTPFGHAGERALHGLMREHGGFEHNRQSLRLVDVLEVRSSEYRGLNLTQETRAGILKHGDRFPAGHPVPLPELERCPSLEAQIADAADEVAYHNHDIDDGLRSGLVEWDALLDVPVWRDAIQAARKATGTGSGGDERVQRARAIVHVIDHLATDLIETSFERLRGSGVQSADEVRQLDRPVIGCSPETVTEARELARFLRENLYRHHQVVRMAAKAERILRDLWDAYTNDPRQLPPQALERADDESHERCIADYLAGMTDRFAMDEHRKLFDPHAHV